MVRTRSFWRAVAMVLMCGALALPALAQNASDMTNASNMSTLNANSSMTTNAANAQDMSNARSANTPTSGGLSSGAAQGGASTATTRSSDNDPMWTIGFIALAVIVVGAIVWAASSRNYEPRPMSRA